MPVCVRFNRLFQLAPSWETPMGGTMLFTCVHASIALARMSTISSALAMPGRRGTQTMSKTYRALSGRFTAA